MRKIQELGGIELSPDSAYSPDRTPLYYHLFQSTANFLRARLYLRTGQHGPWPVRQLLEAANFSNHDLYCVISWSEHWCLMIQAFIILYRVCMYVCKVICPKAGLSLDMHYQGSTYLSLLDKRKEWSICQVLSSLRQWPYGNTFHCTHRHKDSANTTTKHPIPQIAPEISQR